MRDHFLDQFNTDFTEFTKFPEIWCRKPTGLINISSILIESYFPTS